MKALVDNDVLFKGTQYALLNEMIGGVPPEQEKVGVLGSAQFMLERLLKRNPDKAEAEAALTRLLDFISQHVVLEPSEEEQAIAAEFEGLALRENLQLDAGESQLCAILILRNVPLLITGDKRAIESLEPMIDLHISMKEIIGKVMCIEQLVRQILSPALIDQIKSAICRMPKVDKVLYICCGCSSEIADIAAITEGLDSYIRAIRNVAQRALLSVA